MWLKSIELIGFKSFASKTTLEFLPPTEESRGITAIVGPNGSGKSCVVDAIRWVLGEQSMKLLRGKRSEDVIFAGTPKRPRLGVAEVALHLDNEDHAAPIDFTEVTIGRRVYRSGESEYLLNGTVVRREDVLLLLAGARVGQRTYSIIGQGMVDAFLLASPTERKAFFDEAAGIRPAELKRDQAIGKLEAARTNLQQGEVLLAELTPRLRSLTRQMKRLERRDEVERELRGLLEETYGARWHALTQAFAAATTAWKGADDERKRLQTGVDAIQRELVALERTEERSDAFLPLQREYESLVDRRQELRERLLALRHAQETATIGTGAPLPVTAITPDLDAILAELDELLAALRLINRVDDLRPTTERLTGIHERLRVLRTKCVPTDPTTPPPELTEVDASLRALETKLAEVQRRMTAVHEEERRKKGAFFELQRRYHQQQLGLNDATTRSNDFRIELARLEQQREDLRREVLRDLGDTTAPDALPQPTEALPGDTPNRIAYLRREVAAIGSLDDQTLAEYHEMQERVAFLELQTKDLRTSITSLEGIITELDREIERAFQTAFTTINGHFERYFRQLFGGGHATLALLRETIPEDAEHMATDVAGVPIPDVPPTDVTPRRGEPTIAGIDIHATPPGKRIKHLAMLSGGERALVAIALLCAIVSASQSPFVVLDEVDAALDESNSVRFAEILKDLSRRTQFLVVTHNRYTMERAAMIYGVTMADDGASKLLSLRLEDAAPTSVAVHAAA